MRQPVAVRRPRPDRRAHEHEAAREHRGPHDEAVAVLLHQQPEVRERPEDASGDCRCGFIALASREGCAQAPVKRSVPARPG